MAFLCDEKRDLNIRVGDIDIETAPGMYDVPNPNQKKSFNVQPIPFGSRVPRNEFVKKATDEYDSQTDFLNNYIRMLKDQKFQYLKNQVIFKGNVYTQRPDISEHQKIRSRSLNASLNTQGFSVLNSDTVRNRDAEEQESDAKRGPGMYY